MAQVRIKFELHPLPEHELRKIQRKYFSREYFSFFKEKYWVRVWGVDEELLEKYSGEELLEYFGVSKKYYISHIEEEIYSKKKLLKNNLRDDFKNLGNQT